MATPVVETGENRLPILRDAFTIGRISAGGAAVTLLGLSIALALLTYGARRFDRLVLVGAAAAGLTVLPTDIGGRTTAWASWLMFAALSAIVLLGVAVITGVPRHRPTRALLAALAPAAAFGMVLLSLAYDSRQIDPNLPPDAVASLTIGEALNGVSGMYGLFIALAMWAVVEYSRSVARVASQALDLHARWWAVLVLALALKMVWLIAAELGALPVLQPAVTPLDVNESPLSLALALAFAAVLIWFAARGGLPNASSRVTTGVFWLIVTPLIVAFAMPQAMLAFLGALVRFAARLGQITPEQNQGLLDALSVAVQTTNSIALTTAPLIATLTALAAAWYLRRFHPERAVAAPFLTLFGAWMVIPSLAWFALDGLGLPIWDAPPDQTGAPALLGGVHPVTIDAMVTLAVIIMAGIALYERRWRIAPALLLAVLAVSTLIAYGDLVAAPGMAVALFWLGLGFPVFVQYGLDAAELNRPAPLRAQRVLFTLGLSLLAVAVSYAAITVGTLAPGDVGAGAIAKRMILVPFAMIFLLAFVAERFSGERPTQLASASTPVALVPSAAPALTEGDST